MNIIYTGSLNGELEPCGCTPATDFGGLARLSGYLFEKRDELSPYILVDAGNFTLQDTPQGRLKAKAMLEAFRVMDYNTVALQENERDFPEEYLLPLIRETGIVALSETGGMQKSAVQNVESSSLRISADPGDIGKESLNILLTDRTISECKDFKGWDIIISSSGEEIEKPLLIDGTIITSGSLRGKKAGILTIETDPAGKLSGFRHRWQPLGNDIKEDERVRTILNAYDKKVAELLKQKDYLPPGTTYLGVSKCAECHQLFVESWQDTRHASAFSSLEDVGKSSDPECLVCHTVGFGEKGGFHTIETTPGLANVQCEVCHGLDREHITDYSRPMKPVIEAICLRCHTESNSPDFNYSEYFDKIKH